ncbi:universal stress protein [Flavitalea flava]
MTIIFFPDGHHWNGGNIIRYLQSKLRVLFSLKRIEFMKILLATDGSTHSKAMVKKFAIRTLASNTKLRIISAYEKPSTVMYLDPVGISNDYYGISLKYSLKLAEKAIENAAMMVHKNHPKLSISTAAIEGSPKSIILEQAKQFNADLIVVGSHGHGAVASFLLGSVSQAVALHAKCSV